MSTITEAFETHAQRIASGYAAMTPAPSRQRFNPHPTMTTQAPEPTTESTDELVIRESGLVGGFELRWHSPANIEALTSDILTKKERTEISGIAEATARLGAEVAKADLIPRNPAKVAAAWSADHPGDPVPQNLIEMAANGEELRRFAKSTAKAAAVNFFDTHAVPAIHGIFKKAAARLADVITERVKAEQAAFEKFAELYHDDDIVAYRPSNGVLRLIARRRQLLDNEIQRTSPPSVRASLAGVFTV
ncbi:MAG: hypothetical protein NTZ94_07060 [Verrucomicrobia bacterium]|nr:hypothetical protein [Verrucomicrobiota bacterium]